MSMTTRIYLIAILASLFAGPSLASAESVAVIVNKGSDLTNLSSAELKLVFQGDRTAWKGGAKVQLVGQEGEISKRFSKAALGVTAKQLQKLWLKKVFQGAIEPPKTFADAESVKKFVAAHPGAIGFIKASAVDSTVKVIKIDSTSIDQEKYPLK